MTIGTSSSLSQDFTDQLSAELLIAPDSQYVFATMAGAARAAAMNLPDAAGEQGADATVATMGTVDRMGAAGAGFCKVVSEPTTPGKVILIDRPVYLSGLMTQASRVLTEGTRIGSTPIAPTLAQVSFTIVEVGGPHDGSNVVPIAIADYAKRRSKHDLLQYIAGLLRRDRNAVVDRTIIDLLLTTSNQTTPAAVATGSMTTGGNLLTEATLATMKRKLLERSIPPFSNGRYMLVLGPRHEENLRADSAFREISRYQDNGPLLTGYLTTFGGFDICISNNIPTVGVGSGGAVVGYQGMAFGPQAIGWAIGMDVAARRSKDDDFGREDRFTWLAHEAFQILNTAFVEKLVTS